MNKKLLHILRLAVFVVLTFAYTTQQATASDNDLNQSNQFSINKTLQNGQDASLDDEYLYLTTPITVSEIKPSEKTGFIEGEALYPSDATPSDTKIYAENQATGKTYVTGLSPLNDPTVLTDEIRYRLRVPVGTYHVFAMSSHLSKDKYYRAYYSEFVTCGLNVKCKSHKPINVKVTADKTIKKIDPCDWYDRAQHRWLLKNQSN